MKSQLLTGLMCLPFKSATIGAMVMTQDQVRNLFEYREGHLYWREKRPGVPDITRPAGCIHEGYIRISVNRKRYMAHNLVYLYFFGYAPEMIDHIDTDRSNNKIENLRECTKAQNMCNHGTQKNNRIGVKNIHIRENGKYRVCVGHKGKKYGSTHERLDDAIVEAKKLRERLHGEFANHG